MDATQDSAPGPVRPNMLQQLWHRRGIVAATFCATFAAIMVLLMVVPVSFVATGAVIVTDREPVGGSAAASAASTQKIGDPADMESTILLIRSPSLLRAMLEQPSVVYAVEEDCRALSHQLLARLRAPDCSRLSNNLDAQLGWVEDRFGIGAAGRSRVVTVGYKSSAASVAPVLVNGLIRTFLANERAKLMHPRDDAVIWASDRLKALSAEMQSDESAIEEYRSRNGLVRGIAGPLSAERLTQAGQALAEARSGESEAILRMQEANGGGSSRQALESRPIADLKQQLATARAQAASSALRLGAANPQMQSARQLESTLSRQLGAETGRIAAAAKRNLDAAHARVLDAQKDLDRRTRAASDAAGSETQIASMVRDLEIKRTTFTDLSQRLNQLETERRVLEPSVQLVNMAEAPTRPAFPQRTPFIVGGLTLASVLATAAGLLTYRTPQTGTGVVLGGRFMRMPILAQIPELRLRRAGKKELLSRKRAFPLAAALSLIDSHPPLLEALRILYARLSLAGFGTRRRTLMITSEMEGEGKSFVTLALARLARASGQRVLVIECSLRQPFLEEALSGPPTPGLGGYLLGGPIGLVKLGAAPGVDFLLAGDPLSTSTELLAGRRLKELLDWAQDYDLVLIDSAPVSTVMDTALLAPHMDGVLFCLRAGRAPMSGGLSSLPEMQRDNGNVVGLAMTFIQEERTFAPMLSRQTTMQLPQRVHA